MKSLLSFFSFLVSFQIVSQSLSQDLKAESTSEIQAISDADYGEIYILQKQELQKQRWETQLHYSYGFSNPYIGIHGVQIAVNRRMSPFFRLGLEPHYYARTEKRLAQDLKDNLSAQNIGMKVFRPSYAAYSTATLIPLSGMLNWFNSSTIDFDLNLQLGLGVIKYTDINALKPSVKLGVAPLAMVTKNFGITASVQSYFDRIESNDIQNRFETSAGVVGRF